MQVGDELAPTRRVLTWILVTIGALVTIAVILAAVVWFKSPQVRSSRLQAQSQAAVAQGDAVTAIAKAKEAVALTPTDSDAWYALGLAHYQARQWKDAYDAIDAANVKGGRLRSSLTQYLAYTAWMHAVELAHADEFDEAVKWMETAIAEEPTDARAVSALAAIYYGAEDWEKCLATYERALAMDKTLDDVREYAAFAAAMASTEALEAHDVEAAEAFVVRGEKSGATSAALIAQRAAIASEREDWEQSRSLLLQIKTLDASEWRNQAPLFTYVTAMLAVQATAKGDDEAAVRFRKESLEAAPNDVDAKVNLAHGHYRRKQWDLAVELYEEATEDDPARATLWSEYHANALWFLSHDAIDDGDYKKAIGLMLKSVGLHDENPRAFLHLSTCYGLDKDWAKADVAIERARAKGATEEDIRISREWLDAERAADDGV